MSKFFKRLILLTNIFIISTVVLSGCSTEDESKALVKMYEYQDVVQKMKAKL